MAKRNFLSFACALLLLVAQHGALIHSVWHLRDRLPAQSYSHVQSAQAQHGQDEGQTSQSRLCDLHLAMGALLAADCGAQPVLAAGTDTLHFSPRAIAWRVAETTATPPSRAPPVLL